MKQTALNHRRWETLFVVIIQLFIHLFILIICLQMIDILID